MQWVKRSEATIRRSGRDKMKYGVARQPICAIKRIWKIVGLFLLAETLPCLPAFAEQATIVADRETAIFAENPDNNLGVGNLIAGTNAFGGDNARSLIAFNVASMIPNGSIVNSV